MDFITIGKIVKPKGLKGEVKVKLFTNYSAAVKALKVFYVGQQKNIMKAKTVSIRDGFAYILFENVSTIEQAELLRNSQVFAAKNNFITQDEGTFLIEDILGFQIVDENENYLGELIEVEQYGAADVWIMRGMGRTYSFPYISAIVKKVDVQNKQIVVDKKAFDEGKI
ncbi:MAG: ribosome maturation factor RimM [Christensenellales bacterium]|jgi:16S rRNA processing protein RimM